ncbi:MAG: Gfo/Idh/MocA family oxidoreductase [bacterium]|nr:Gfo/Idh/MocA family oxidoreductase [bacterium]
MSEKNNTIGVAVIGLKMGRAHLEGYRNDPRTKILAVCDTDTELLGRIREEFGVETAVTGYRELLNNPDIGIISVATPDFIHAEQCIAALKAGKDVLCEKPMTADLDEALKIVKVVRETGRKFMIGQVCRYAPGFVLAKKMVERGEIGELYLVESEYAHSYKDCPGTGDWRKDPRREPFIGGGCHAVDLLRWVAGNAEEVFAYANHKCLTDWPVNDCTTAVFKFAGGVIGKVMVSIGCIRPYTMRSVFYGTEGTIICDNTSPQIQLCSRKNYRVHPEFATFPVDIKSHNVGDEIADFLDCITGDKPVVANELEGAITVATCLAAVESVASGMPVKVREVR